MNASKSQLATVQNQVVLVLLILLPFVQSCVPEQEKICPEPKNSNHYANSRQIEIEIESARLFEEYEKTADMQVIVAYAPCHEIDASANTWTSQVVETFPGETISLDFPMAVESVSTITSGEPMLIYILAVDNKDLSPLTDKTWDIAGEFLAEIVSTPLGLKGFILEQLITEMSDKAKEWYEKQEILAEVLVQVPVTGEPEVLHEEMAYAKLSYRVQTLDSPTPTVFELPTTVIPTVTPTSMAPLPLHIDYTYEHNCLPDSGGKWSVTIYIEVSGGTPPFTYFMHGDHEEKESDRRKFNYEWQGNTGGNFVRTLEVQSLDGQKVNEEIYIENTCDRNG